MSGDTSRKNVAKARKKSAARFDNAEERSAHFREMAAKSAEVRASRVYLTREEASALVDAYALLRSIARRSKVRNLVTDDPENDDAPADVTGASLGGSEHGGSDLPRKEYHDGGTGAALTGKWAHVMNESGTIERQCRILRPSGESAYLVQWYEWLGGGPSTMTTVSIDEVGSGRWVLYESSREMREAYEVRSTR